MPASMPRPVEPAIDVTHVIPYMHPLAGGPPVVVDRFCRLLAQRGQLIHVLTTNALAPAGASDWTAGYRGSYHLHVVETRRPNAFAFAPGLRQRLAPLIAASRLVHLHTLWSFPCNVAARLCRQYHVPYVVMPHGMLDPHSLQRKRLKKRLFGVMFEWPNLRRAAAVIYTHPEERRLAQQSVPRLPPGFVVPLGADQPPDIPHEQLAGGFLNTWPALKDRRLIVFLSRLHPKKGLDLLIPAMAILARSHPDAHLLLVGQGDPDYSQLLRQLIQQHALQDRVTLTGPLHGIAKWQALAAGTLFVLPSYQENFALVVTEALAMRLPVVLSRRVNIWSDLVQAGAALACDLEPASIAASLAGYLDNPPLRAAAANAAAHLAQHQFNWHSAADRLQHVYHQILAATP